jgi:DNA-binding NarL/FixJ family response regulator
MTSKPRGKQMVEETIGFNIDFKNWQNTLSRIERRILQMLLHGYSATKIAEKIKLSYIKVKECINRMREGFIRYFHINKPLAALG